MTAPVADEVYEFDDFVLAPGERLLLGPGKAVPLIAKAFDLLVALVRRNGHLVTKDELFQAVWPDRFVEEVNLSVNISAVRKALGRRPDGTSPIQTVSKGGYRFVAPVTVGGSIIDAVSLWHSRSPSTVTPLGPQTARVVTANTDAYRAYLEPDD